MDYLSESFVFIGLILLSGLAIDYFGKLVRLPRVTILLLFGFFMGPSGFNLLMSNGQIWLPVVTDVALLMIGFLLGGKLSKKNLRKHGRQVFYISLAAALVTAVVVSLGLLLLGVRPEVALLLAAIATATAPAATVDIIHEMRAKGLFTKTLLGIVAIDDAWGLIIFSITLTLVNFYGGNGVNVADVLAGGWEIAGAFFVGIGIGVPAAYFTGRIQAGEPTLVEAIGVISLCGGIALAFEVSLLLAVMVMGATIVNLAKHHVRPFHEIERVEWPFMIMFFVLAGASLNIDMLIQMGFIGVAYIILRIIGKIIGAWLGSKMSHASDSLRKWTGIAMMPQAGVALGMALIVDQRFPEYGYIVLNIVIGAVVVFELFGPIMTRLALQRSGDAKELSRKDTVYKNRGD